MRTTLVFLVLMMLSASSFAANRVIIIPQIARYYQTDGNGAYQKLMREILRRSGESAELLDFPLSRATVMFDRDKNACYPVSLKLATDVLGYKLIATSESINRFKVVFATLKGNPGISSFEQLRGRSIAALPAADLPAYGYTASSLTIHYVDTLDQGLEMLEAGKVNAMLGSVADLIAYKSKVNYDTANPVYAVDESLVCHPGAASAAFLNKVNSAIHSMKLDGSLKSILGEYYLLD